MELKKMTNMAAAIVGFRMANRSCSVENFRPVGSGRCGSFRISEISAGAVELQIVAYPFFFFNNTSTYAWAFASFALA